MNHLLSSSTNHLPCQWLVVQLCRYYSSFLLNLNRKFEILNGLYYFVELDIQKVQRVTNTLIVTIESVCVYIEGRKHVAILTNKTVQISF